MENSISFNPKWLKAAALIAARNDIRYYLNGVFVEVFDHEARLVATDGHRMVIFRKLVEGATPVKFIVPIGILDLLKPSLKHPKLEAGLLYDPASPLGKVTLEYSDVGIQFKPIDGKFPDYTQTLNKAAAPTGEVSNVNWTYLADFKRATDMAFGADRFALPTIKYNGDGPAAVSYKGQDNFFGLVMPMRLTDSFSVPKWALPLPEEKREPEEALAA